MPTVNVDEAQAQWSELLEMVERGESVTIVRAGHPIADLVPRAHVGLSSGLLQGRVLWDADTFDDEDADVLNLFGIS